VDPITKVLTQYGAVGLIALIAVMVARYLYLRLADAHADTVAQLERRLAEADARAVRELALERERTAKETLRGDRVAEELARLNETVRNEYVNTIARTSQALADAGRDVAAVRSASARRR
jgi:hypothetical protein